MTTEALADYGIDFSLSPFRNFFPLSAMKKKKILVKAVLFDMDGVITNTMPDHYRAWRSVLREEVGIEVSHEEIYRREGQKGIASVQELFAEHKKFYLPETGKAILRKKEELFKKIVKTRFIQGARRFLSSLQRLGLEMALVTGTSTHEMHRILPDAIYRRFSVVVTGNHVTEGKPSPEPYALALKKLGMKPRDAVVIENAPFGVRSAKSAGIKCFAIATSLPACYLNEADEIFSSFRDLNQKIEFALV